MLSPLNTYSNVGGQKGNLKGISSFNIQFYIEEVYNLKKDPIINDVKLKLFQSEFNIDKKSPNYLIITVSIVNSPNLEHIVAADVSLSLHTLVKKSISNDAIHAIIWETRRYGMVGIDKVYTLRRVVNDLVDVFIVDYLETNPKKK
jgi:hypothetical protein